MSEDHQHNTPDAPDAPDPRARRAALIGLIFVLALVVGGLLLTHVMRRVSELQDCTLSGRTDCAPIDSSATGNP